MAEGIGTFTLAGNLTSDPKLFQSQNGKAYGFIKLAINRRVKDGDDWKDKPSFVDVSVFGRSAENAAKYLSKGDQVTVVGRIESKMADAEKFPYQIPCLVADSMVFKRKPQEQSLGEYAAQQEGDVGGVDFGSDDIPF